MLSGTKRKKSPSPSPRTPGFKNPHNNHAPASAIHYLGQSEPSDDEQTETPRTRAHTVTLDDRAAIWEQYSAWRLSGSLRSASPISSLRKEYGVGKNYFTKLREKFDRTLSLHDAPKPGRPKTFDESTKAEILKVAEARAEKQLTASSRIVAATLKKDKAVVLKPSERTVRRLKSEMRFHVIKVELKPILSDQMREQRLKFVKWALVSVDWSRVIVIDEKWFTEEKVRSPKIELPVGHIPPAGRKKFAGKRTDGGTAQLHKLMYLSAVSVAGGIGMWELDFSEHTRTIKSGKRKGEVVKAGVDSKFLLPFWKKIKKAGLEILGPGPLNLWLDRASCHRSATTKAELEKLGFTVIDQPPRSPECNMLDAFLFPSLERECNKRGATTHDEIRKAVKYIWKRVTPAECTKAQARVVANMKKIKEMDGGNMYHEGGN